MGLDLPVLPMQSPRSLYLSKLTRPAAAVHGKEVPTAAIRRFFNIRRLDRESEEDPHELSGLFPRVIPYTDQTGIILRAQRQRG
jgi:hypothetical protein